MEDIDREIEGNNAVRRPRIFRDRADPFETLNDEQFRLRYRFSRRGFFTLLESLEDSITTSDRKSYHSLNVGLACDYDLSFIWISCRFGGSAHDSRVFRKSALHADLQSGEKKGILLGDSAYRAETYLYKPILNSQNEAEKKYTDAVCRGRVRIENAIGALKRQFHSLHSEVRYAPDMASLIITAAVCLRNASILLNERPFDDDLGDEDDDDDGYDDPNAPSASGQAAMKYVVQKYFS
ncbi:hypothetical protein CAEBREN_29807 [Caenorhabditis brenneri]|uniref:DDE Tnp4 domain-containing protein n=1 Tax=Caenorhabditis brenneri TaxID=135651 RepID=G0PC72_CAEBE|nr:hypothetical protein CAEBREN_29807 [Caenorhabditis brenneri]